jgi:hypothetical protein
MIVLTATCKNGAIALNHPSFNELEGKLVRILVEEIDEQSGSDNDSFSDEISTRDLMNLAMVGGSFDFLYDEPDIYTLEDGEPVSIQEISKVTKGDRRAFMQLSIEERRRILAQQAEAMVEHYQQDLTWQDWTSFGLEADRKLPLV